MLKALEVWQVRDGSVGFLVGKPQLIETLDIDPEFSTGPEKMRKAQRRVPSDGPAPVQDLGDAVRGNIELASKFSGAHAQLSKLRGQVFPRVNCNERHNSLLIIITTCAEANAYRS